MIVMFWDPPENCGEGPSLYSITIHSVGWTFNLGRFHFLPLVDPGFGETMETCTYAHNVC